MSGLIQFGEFVLDCNRHELLRAGHPIKLEKFPMELLIRLVTRGGHLVTGRKSSSTCGAPRSCWILNMESTPQSGRFD